MTGVSQSVRRRTLRILRSRRLFDTRPATFLDHFLCTPRKAPKVKRLRHSWAYARDLFEWTPFWPALLLNRQNRRPR